MPAPAPVPTPAPAATAPAPASIASKGSCVSRVDHGDGRAVTIVSMVMDPRSPNPRTIAHAIIGHPYNQYARSTDGHLDEHAEAPDRADTQRCPHRSAMPVVPCMPTPVASSSIFTPRPQLAAWSLCTPESRTQPRTGVEPGDPQHEAEGWTRCPRGRENAGRSK